METKIRNLCEANNLTCISVMFYPNRTTLFLHWDDADGVDTCISSDGATFDEAFAKALTEVDHKREPGLHDILPRNSGDEWADELARRQEQDAHSDEPPLSPAVETV